ncbi:ArsR/SmtB family transcription factor [Streptomyces albus]|uniref:ArsR/SmtB family transcription factor n=1 Tax=Streptomyces TaxID=1883 RepID=UPI000B141543|nr:MULTISPECIES: helix-turn-helix domain-containing protein [Streptomyces]UVN55900.1 helix-turn-helix domain-containing protein [Streptomyces albus]
MVGDRPDDGQQTVRRAAHQTDPLRVGGGGDQRSDGGVVHGGAVVHDGGRPAEHVAGPGGEPACTTFALPVSKSTQSGHFKVLREAGVIHQRHEGTRRPNRLRRDDLEARFPGLLALAIPRGRDVIAGW